MFNFLFPDHQFDGILDICCEWLRQQEVFTIFLDVDSTLKRYRDPQIIPEIAEWLRCKQREGFQFCLLSNGLNRRICRLADELELPHLAPAFKPFPFGCKKAMRMLHWDPQYTALIGDQIFADVMAANFAGIRSIWVKPIHPWEEPLFTRVKRPFEKLVLGYCAKRHKDDEEE
jgi:HAD superfamily (subfamily IIIA) phosphatase, TIGR01668